MYDFMSYDTEVAVIPDDPWKRVWYNPDEDIDREYIGKRVQITGVIGGNAGTVYYRRNVNITQNEIIELD